jgi:hypothetical protein
VFEDGGGGGGRVDHRLDERRDFGVVVNPAISIGRNMRNGDEKAHRLRRAVSRGETKFSIPLHFSAVRSSSLIFLRE